MYQEGCPYKRSRERSHKRSKQRKLDVAHFAPPKAKRPAYLWAPLPATKPMKTTTMARNTPIAHFLNPRNQIGMMRTGMVIGKEQEKRKRSNSGRKRRRTTKKKMYQRTITLLVRFMTKLTRKTPCPNVIPKKNKS